jgi:hypothetical protein
VANSIALIYFDRNLACSEFLPLTHACNIFNITPYTPRSIEYHMKQEFKCHFLLNRIMIVAIMATLVGCSSDQWDDAMDCQTGAQTFILIAIMVVAVSSLVFVILLRFIKKNPQHEKEKPLIPTIELPPENKFKAAIANEFGNFSGQLNVFLGNLYSPPHNHQLFITQFEDRIRLIVDKYNDDITNSAIKHDAALVKRDADLIMR